jgi:CDP-diacylglycerol--glycerol-3-phosphate 3-phosphatidyltransferase
MDEVARKQSLWTYIPTALTMLRIVLVVPIWLVLYVPLELGYATALLLFVLAAASDLVDGWLARKLDAVTKFGSNLDVIADKILVVGVLSGLAVRHRLDALAVAALFVIALREIVVVALRFAALRRGRALGASLIAKAKTMCQMTGVAALLAVPFAGAMLAIGDWLLVIGAALGLISGAQYWFSTSAPEQKTREPP